MTVLGVGIDLVWVPGFGEQLAKPGSTMAQQVFTATERAYCEDAGPDRIRSYAARWAAKEALIKAWSTALFGRAPVTGEHVHRLIEVVNDAWGRPSIRLHGQAQELLAGSRAHLSLTHDGDSAAAVVVLESTEPAAASG